MRGMTQTKFGLRFTPAMIADARLCQLTCVKNEFTTLMEIPQFSDFIKPPNYNHWTELRYTKVGPPPILIEE
jgi:hypothetical protein